MKRLITILVTVTVASSVLDLNDTNNTSNYSFPTFPWTENLIRFPLPYELHEDYIKLKNFTLEELNQPRNVSVILNKTVEIPESLKPFVNMTTIEKLRKQQNRTEVEDELITDDDVADEDENHKDSPPLNTPHYDGKKTTIPISTEAGVELYQHWIDQAVSGLMAAVATNKLSGVPDFEKEAHHKCSKSAKTVQAHAKCVVALMNAERRFQKWNKQFSTVRRVDYKKIFAKTKEQVFTRKQKLTKKKSRKTPISEQTISYLPDNGWLKHTNNKSMSKEVSTLSKSKQLSSSQTGYTSEGGELFPVEDGWVDSFRMRAKRSLKPIQKTSYTLREQQKYSPFALLAQKLTNTVRAIKHKDGEQKSWQEIVAEIKEEGMKLKKKRKAKQMMEKRFDIYMRAMKESGIDPKDGVPQEALEMFKDEDEEDTDLMLLKAKEAEKTMSTEDRIMREPIKLIREGVKLGMVMSGQNVSDFDKKNIKMVSPRMLSVVPEELSNDTINLLSPSLFALHNEGKGLENEMSIAKALDYFIDSGHQEWMNFIIEASGVSDAVKRMKEMKVKEEESEMNRQMRGPDGQPLYFTKENVTEMYGDFERRKIETFENLQKTFTEEQLRDEEKNGFFIMTHEQRQLIYGENSPYNSSETIFRLRNVTTNNSMALIESEIRQLAELRDWRLRQKDIVATPLVNSPMLINNAPILSQPVILSPLVLSPSILTPAVLGPVILGPWVFIPVILSPRVLSPLIVNPLIFSPIILSPLVLHPLILAPGIFNPLILSPLVLSPFILSPQVFTPLILSPFVLTPIILTPAVGSPLILSPFVLSPIILSPQVLFAVVLSPYALSPLVETKLIVSSVVLSPSWLS